MNEYGGLNHTKWEWKYDVVFIPKCWRKVPYASLRKHLDSLLQQLVLCKEWEIREGRPMVDCCDPVRLPEVTKGRWHEIPMRYYIREILMLHGSVVAHVITEGCAKRP